MVARFARGALRAACVVGVLTWLAAAGTGGAVRGQEFASDWQTYDQFVPEASGAAGYSSCSCDTSDSYGGGCACDDEYVCGDACGCGDVCCDGSHSQSFGCCFGPYTGGQRWWVGAELLLWRIDGMDLPPLVTESSGVLPPTLNLPTTDVIAGDSVSGNSWRTGYRLELGVWFDDCQELALVGDYFNVGQDDYDYFFPGGSGRNTGRPFFDTENGINTVRLISAPGLVDGTVAITADDDFQGAGIGIQQRVYSVGALPGYGPGTHVMLLGGYRFLSYDSQLSIRDHRTILDGNDEGDQDFRHDMFNTDNEFHGGEFGVQAKFAQTGCWFEGLAKLAIGGHSKRATVSGATVSIPSGMPVELGDGGLLTSGETNIGTYRDSRVRFIPTFRFGVGAYLTPQWSVQAGYTAIIWSGVARAGGLTPPNLGVDPRNIPPVTAGGGPAPVFPGIGGSELVAHGLDLGVEYRY